MNFNRLILVCVSPLIVGAVVAHETVRAARFAVKNIREAWESFAVETPTATWIADHPHKFQPSKFNSLCDVLACGRERDAQLHRCPCCTGGHLYGYDSEVCRCPAWCPNG